MATNHEANVTLGGDASGAQAAARGAAKEVDAFDKAVGRAKLGASKLSDSVRQSAKSWDVQAEAAKRSEQANYVAAARMQNANDRAEQLNRTFGKAGQVSTLAANGITRVGAAAHHGRGPMQAMGSAVHNLSAGQATLSQSVNMVLSSFGPWGMVIGAAVGALGHFIAEQLGAAEASEAATKKIREEALALKDLDKAGRLRALTEATNAEQKTNWAGGKGRNWLGWKTEEGEKAEEKLKAIKRTLGDIAISDKARAAVEKRDIEFEAREAAKQEEVTRRVKIVEEDIFEIEKQKIMNKKAGVDSSKLEVQQLKLQADIADKRGDQEESARLLRQAELRDLEGINTKERARTKEKEKQIKLMTDRELSASMAGPNFRRQVANVNADALFASELDAARNAQTMKGMKRGPVTDPAELARQNANDRFNDTMRGLEGGAANDGGVFGQLDSSPEVQRIEAEKAARMDFNDFMLTTTQGEVERLALLDERKQISHEASLATIAAETQAEQQRVATFAGLAQQTVGALLNIGDARRNATRLAKLQGATDKEAARAGKIAALEQTAAALRSVRDMAAMKAVFEAAESIAAFARYDIPGGIGHAAAAAAYGAVAVGTGLGARALESRADGMKPAGGFGGFGGSGGTGSGRGSSSNPRSGPAPVDSPIPGSPSPQAPSTGGGGGQQNSGGTHLHLHGPVFGVPKKQFWLEADRELASLSHGGRRTG